MKETQNPQTYVNPAYSSPTSSGNVNLKVNSGVVAPATPITQQNQAIQKSIEGTATQPTEQPTAPTAGIEQGIQRAQKAITETATSMGKTITPNANGTYSALSDQYNQGLKLASQSGVPAPQDASAGFSGASQVLKNVPTQAPTTSPTIDEFFSANKNVTGLSQETLDFLSPENTSKTIQKYMGQLATDRAELSNLKVELMSNKRIISGTANDIRKEIEAAGGLATESMVSSLSIARNQSLIERNTQLQELISYQNDLVSTDTTLLSEEKQLASQQFTQRMSLLNYIQENKKDMFNAFKDTVNTLQKSVGWAGVYEAYKNNPAQLANVEALYGGTGSLAKLAAQPDLEKQKTELEIQKLQNEISGAGKGEDLSAYVTAYQTGQIPLTQVPQKIRGTVLSQVQASGYNKMQDLLTQYRDKLDGLNFFSANMPTNKALLGSLGGQITAEYKQQKQLGTLDVGVQNLIDQIIPDPSNLSISSLSNKAQVEALDNFIKNQGGAVPAPDGSGDTIIITD